MTKVPGKGDRIRLKDGREGLVVDRGIPDFPNDPFPIYVQVGAERIVLMSDEFKERAEP